MDYLTSLWQKAMESGFLSDMAIAVLLVCAVLLYFVVRYIPLEAAIPFFFKDKDGKKVARGFFGAPLLIIICALVLMLIPTPSKAAGLTIDGIPGSFLNRGTVFMGVDHVYKRTSPVCESGGWNDRATSNMGVKVNVWEAPSRNLRLNLQYTHHSCAIWYDKNLYNGVGLILEWDIWNSY